MGEGVCFALVQLGGVQLPTCSPPVPHILLPSCMACSAGLRGMAGAPGSAAVWFLAASDVPGCAWSARCRALGQS